MTDGEAVAKPPRSKRKSAILITVLSLAIAVMLVVWVVVGYLLYVVNGYYRIADDIALGVETNQTAAAKADGEYTIMTYNVGFGAYGPDYTFFMDTGEMKSGKKTQGKHGTAVSRADVIKNITGSSGVVAEHSPDFAIIQEVDYNSTRSYKVDQREYFKKSGYGTVFAENYHSSYLFYPLTDPHGKNNAGIMTLSKYNIKDSRRYAFPLDDGFGKFTDLDRCYSITHVEVEGGKTLAVISLHMSAYDEGGVIRKQQAQKLKLALEAEYAQGNYVIAGGDFNQDLINNLERYQSEQKIPEWVATYDAADVPAGFSIFADNDAEVGSCRGADVVWERGWTYTCTIDGFIVSDNIEVKSVNTIDTDFAYSDHNPVKLTFSFK